MRWILNARFFLFLVGGFLVVYYYTQGLSLLPSPPLNFRPPPSSLPSVFAVTDWMTLWKNSRRGPWHTRWHTECWLPPPARYTSNFFFYWFSLFLSLGPLKLSLNPSQPNNIRPEASRPTVSANRDGGRLSESRTQSWITAGDIAVRLLGFVRAAVRITSRPSPQVATIFGPNNVYGQSAVQCARGTEGPAMQCQVASVSLVKTVFFRPLSSYCWCTGYMSGQRGGQMGAMSWWKKRVQRYCEQEPVHDLRCIVPLRHYNASHISSGRLL